MRTWPRSVVEGTDRNVVGVRPKGTGGPPSTRPPREGCGPARGPGQMVKVASRTEAATLRTSSARSRGAVIRSTSCRSIASSGTLRQ